MPDCLIQIERGLVFLVGSDHFAEMHGRSLTVLTK